MRLPLLMLALFAACAARADVPTESNPPLRLYLLPGTGADHRLFDRLDLRGYDTAHVRLPVPERRERMRGYAARVLREQLDTTRPFALLGVSLGGMVATELAELADPAFVVVVASATSARELPAGYRFAGVTRVHRLFGGRSMRWFTRALQPWYEPMPEEQRALFAEMLYAKDPAFLRGAVDLMVRWQRREPPADAPIAHLHGTDDRTLPIARSAPTHVLLGGTHMLTYDHPAAVEAVLAEAEQAVRN